MNTGAIAGTLKKWNGSDYGPDIAPVYVDFTGATIGATGAIYPISKLGFGRYQMTYSIENNNAVTSTGNLVFYVDEPEFTISTGSLDIGNLEAGTKKFSDNEFIITVKTVGAPFDVILNKTSDLLNGSVEIIDWSGSEGFGYEVSPYSDTINIIGTNTIVASQSGSINTNGNKNTYQYLIQMGALINEQQAAGVYEGNINFGIKLNY